MNAKCIISLSIEEVSGFPNRQAELDVQAFPNSVWERGKINQLRIQLRNSYLG